MIKERKGGGLIFLKLIFYFQHLARIWYDYDHDLTLKLVAMQVTRQPFGKRKGEGKSLFFKMFGHFPQDLRTILTHFLRQAFSTFSNSALEKSAT